MNIYLVILLGIYLVGVAVFLLRWRDRCLGGWFQTLVTAVSWPMILGIVLYAIAFKKDFP